MDLRRIVIKLGRTNHAPRIEKERLEAERDVAFGKRAGSLTKLDTEGLSKKRSRREVTVGATAGDATGSDTEGRSEKRVRRDT